MHAGDTLELLLWEHTWHYLLHKFLVEPQGHIMASTRRCLEVWLWLFFKVLFTQKSVSIIFFYFLKIIFEISTSKWFENIKNILLQSKKKIQIFLKALLKSTSKQALNLVWCCPDLHFHITYQYGIVFPRQWMFLAHKTLSSLSIIYRASNQQRAIVKQLTMPTTSLKNTYQTPTSLSNDI
jgi:hypothetical protein